MNPFRMVAIVLVVGGAFAVAYGGFSFTKDTHHADVGPLHMSVAERENVNIPQWAGFGAMLAGVLLLVVPFKKT